MFRARAANSARPAGGSYRWRVLERYCRRLTMSAARYLGALAPIAGSPDRWPDRRPVQEEQDPARRHSVMTRPFYKRQQFLAHGAGIQPAAASSTVCKTSPMPLGPTPARSPAPSASATSRCATIDRGGNTKTNRGAHRLPGQDQEARSKYQGRDAGRCSRGFGRIERLPKGEATLKSNAKGARPVQRDGRARSLADPSGAAIAELDKWQ